MRFLGLLKYKNKDLFYTRVRDYFISEKLGEKFGFSDEVKAQVLVHLKKSHTWDIEDDEDKKTNQIAFEIAEKYNRPAHAESKNINELDKFLLNGK